MPIIHPTEVFREIDGLPGYRFSDLGRIQTRWVPCHPILSATWRDRFPYRSRKDGYLYGVFKTTQGRRTFKIHRLIALAFHGPCPPGMEVRHLNGIRQDCRAENLCYGTAVENQADRVLHGKRQVGSAVPGSKLTEDQVAEIIKLFRGGPRGRRPNENGYTGLGRKFGVSTTVIYDIIRGKTWKHVSSGAWHAGPES
jgi:hypothetical protein